VPDSSDTSIGGSEGSEGSEGRKDLRAREGSPAPQDVGSTLAAVTRKIGKRRRGSAEPEPEQTRLGKALELLKTDPSFPLDKLATMFQLSVAQLREATA
jgi:hypothetical protein